MKKHALILCITLGFCAIAQSAEPARHDVQKIAYHAQLRKIFEAATPLCENTTKICLGYVSAFQHLKHTSFALDGEASLTCAAHLGERYIVAGSKLHSDLEIIDSQSQGLKKATLFTSGHTKPITAVAWHPSSPLTVITGSQDLTLRAWDIRTGQTTHTLSECIATDMLACVGKTKATSAAGKYVYLWHLYSNENAINVCGSTVNCLLPLHENFCVAAGLENGKIRVFDDSLHALKFPWDIPASQAPILSLACFSPWDLVSLDKNSQVCLWDMNKKLRSSGMLVRTIQLSSVNRLIRCGNEVVAMPAFVHQRGKNVWRLAKASGEIVAEQDDLGLDGGLHIDAACSAGNSFALITRETNDPLYASSVDWDEKPKRNIVHVFRQDNGKAEEKDEADAQVQAWVTTKMKKAQSNCAIS